MKSIDPTRFGAEIRSARTRDDDRFERAKTSSVRSKPRYSRRIRFLFFFVLKFSAIRPYNDHDTSECDKRIKKKPCPSGEWRGAGVRSPAAGRGKSTKIAQLARGCLCVTRVRPAGRRRVARRWGGFFTFYFIRFRAPRGCV